MSGKVGQLDNSFETGEMKSKNLMKLHIDSRLKNDLVLRRYLDTAKFLDFIHNQTLFFCRADGFEDQFEGSFTRSSKLAIEEAFLRSGTNMDYDEFKNKLRERVFLNCWCRGLDDSMAMWDLYGKSNCSVAITTTVYMLKNQLEQAAFEHSLSITRVDYVKHWRDPKLKIEPYSNVFAYKVKAYEFEKEVRVILDRFDNDDLLDNKYGIPIKVDPALLLRSIVINPDAPEWYVKLIRETVKEKYNIPVDVNRSKLATGPI